MPFVQVHAIKNVFNDDQKKQLLQKITDAMVSVEGEKMRGVTWVTFTEVESGDWAIGGQCITTGDIQRMQKG